MVEKETRGEDEIYTKLSAVYPKAEFKKERNILHLDLNDFRYKLNDLDELTNDYDYIQFFLHLNTIDISNNRLSILKLRNFNYLEKIVGNGNIISKVDLDLPKLKKLDLSSNMLDRVPEMKYLPNLEELRLNRNSISKIEFDDFKHIKATLNTLELEFNKIRFNKVKDFFDFAESFGRSMRRLRALNLQKNPFSISKVYSKEYASVMIFYCDSLNAISGRTIEESEREQSRQINNLKSKIIENEKEYGYLLKPELELKNQFGINSQNEVTIESIKRGMERYQTVSRMGQNSFRELKEIIETYINNSRLSEENYNNYIESENDDNELEEYEKFLEFCNVIIENSTLLEKPLFDIVANFAIIKNGKFSDLSLTFFKHHLSSNEKAKDIQEVIERTIISFINNQQPEDIPATIISGLQAFSSDSKFRKIILDLVKKLRGIIEVVKEVKIIGSKTGDENKKRNILSASLNFLASMADDFDILDFLISTDEFFESLVTHFKNTLILPEDSVMEDERAANIYINLCDIITKICSYNFPEKEAEEKRHYNKTRLESIKSYFATGLKDKIEQMLIKKIDLFSKTLSVSNTSYKMDTRSKEDRLKKRILLASLIRLYGTLLKRTDDKSKLNFSNTSITITMLNIVPLPNFNDPLIIAAICDFIIFILENDLIKSNVDDLFYNIVSKLYSLKYFLIFLFKGTKYNQACFAAELLGQNTVVSGHAVDFENLTSEVMHKMFISIINLITFFGRNQEEGDINIQPLCTNVCADLNDLDRDDALTSCLVIPSDEVKKAVVNCLFYVNCDEFDKDEIRDIYIQISNVNLISGKIEEVISTIYVILTKAFRNFMEKQTLGNSKEKVESNKDAFLIAYDILMKNSERLTSDETETEQKMMLSIALNVFLINCSPFENTKRFFNERKIVNKLAKILMNEDTKLNEKLSFPIEVEKTRAGWSMLNLHDCFKNEYPLYPYSYVGLRLMIHIADMMMNVPYKIYEIGEHQRFTSIIESLKQEMREREFNRIQREMRPFKDFANERKKNKKSAGSLEHMMLTENELREEQYRFISLFPVILHFLLGKTSHTKLAEFEKIWEDKFDPKFSSLSYSLTEFKHSENKETRIKVDQDYLDKEDIFSRVERIMKEESILSLHMNRESVSEYDHIRHDLTKVYLYGSEKDKMKRFKSEESANNPYIRGLVISAFLRSLWTLLELPSEKGVKESLIEVIKKGNNIKDISMLVDSTKLADFNISSKYLTIMRHILSSAKSKWLDENEYLNQIGVISFMLKKMINVSKYTLRIDNEESQIFLSELSKCSAVICNEVYSLHYSNDSIRKSMMSEMISYEIIKVFIKTVKDYMNREADLIIKDLEEMRLRKNKEDLDNSDFSSNENFMVKKVKKDDETMNMLFTISFIIGEYMSKCPEYSYSILESFTRSYIFERVKMRKTYVREVLDTSKMADLRTFCENKLKMKINFCRRCLFNDYNSGTEFVSYLIISDFGLEILNLNTNFECQEWDASNLPDNLAINEKYKIKYEDITHIFELELTNKIFVNTKNSILSFYFLKSHLTNQIIDLVTSQASNIIIERNVKIFKSTNSKFNQEEENSDDCSFLCVIKAGRFGNIFSGLFKEKEMLPNVKVVHLSGRNLFIYKEYLDNWKKQTVSDLLKIEDGCHKIGQISKMFNLQDQYDLSNLTSVRFLKTDQINLTIDGNNLEINTLDDFSYVKLKKVISSVAVENMFGINSDDIYGKI